MIMKKAKTFIPQKWLSVLVYDATHMKFKKGMNTYLANLQNKIKWRSNRNFRIIIIFGGERRGCCWRKVQRCCMSFLNHGCTYFVLILLCVCVFMYVCTYFVCGNFLCIPLGIWKLLHIYQLWVTVPMAVLIYSNKTMSRSGAMILVITSLSLQFSAILHLSYFRAKWRWDRNFHPEPFKSLIVVLISVSLFSKDTKDFMTFIGGGETQGFHIALNANSPYLPSL